MSDTVTVHLKQLDRFRFEIDFAPGLPTLQSDEAPPLGTGAGPAPSHLLAAAARIAGWDPLANRSGSNLERGVVSSFIAAADAVGAIPRAAERLGVVELDEAVWPRLLPRLLPRVAVFLNLFRDQLDRYGEVDSIAEGWQRALASHVTPLTLVLNVDDPSVAALAEAHRGEVIGFGVEDPTAALGEPVDHSRHEDLGH